MMNRVLIVFAVLLLILVVGCAEVSEFAEDITNGSSQQSLDIVREAKLGKNWQLKQMEMELEVDQELSILMKLANGDQVDGYFYLEKGSDIDFQITGDSLIYKSQVPNDDKSEGIVSDRFSFVADKTQGDTYTLTFLNDADDGGDKVKIFLEVIYPVNASLFVPIQNK